MCENMDNTHARRFDDTVRRRAGERGAIMTLRDCPRAMRAFGNERVAVDGGTARAVRVRFARDEHAQDDVA